MDAFTSGFKALSDLTRLRTLRMILATEGPVCVCELADALELPQYQVSKHLALLRQAGLVTDSRRGTWVYYSVPPNISGFAKSLCELTREHLSGSTFDGDAARLRTRLALREDGRCVLGPNKPAPSAAGLKGRRRW